MKSYASIDMIIPSLRRQCVTVGLVGRCGFIIIIGTGYAIQNQSTLQGVSHGKPAPKRILFDFDYPRFATSQGHVGFRSSDVVSGANTECSHCACG